MTILQKFDGRFLRDGETIYRVEGRIKNRPAVQLDLNGEKSEITVDYFHCQISLGNVSEGQEPVFSDRVMATKETSEAGFRERVLEFVDRYQEWGFTWQEILQKLGEDIRNDPRYSGYAAKIPRKRTIQLWRTNFAVKGSRALFDQRYQSGNHEPRYDEIFREIVLDLLDESYLSSDRMTMNDLANQAMTEYLRVYSQEHPKSQPGNCGRKAVVSILDRYVPHADVLKMRRGSKAARKALLQDARFQKIEHAYDRVEVDSTQADIFVLYDGKLIRPWVTMAIDAATGFIVGLTVSLDHPTSLTTAGVLYEAMTGNDEVFFDRYGIRNRVRVAGHALTVVADQGSENSGAIIDRLLSTTAIELQKNIPGHPEKKPFIERAMGTLKTFVTKLEGATQTRELDAKERYDRAREEACWSFEEFVQKVQVWRYDYYGALPRRRVQSPLKRRESPIESWHRLSLEAYVPEPPSKQKLSQMFFCQAVRRTVHRYGIEVGYVQYSSSQLRHLERNSRGRLEVEVRINPADIRKVLIVHPNSGEAIYVPCKDPDMPAISVAERDRILALIRRDRSDALEAHEVLAALVSGRHHKPSKATTKGAKQRHAAQRKKRDDDIVNRHRRPQGPTVEAEDQSPALPVFEPKRRNQISGRR
jgi:transposase InsO family protein